MPIELRITCYLHWIRLNVDSFTAHGLVFFFVVFRSFICAVALSLTLLTSLHSNTSHYFKGYITRYFHCSLLLLISFTLLLVSALKRNILPNAFTHNRYFNYYPIPINYLTKILISSIISLCDLPLALFTVQNEILRTQNEFCVKIHNIFARVRERARNCHHNDRLHHVCRATATAAHIILVFQCPVHRPPFRGRFSHFCVLLHFSFNSTCHQRRFSELIRTSWNSLAFRLN